MPRKLILWADVGHCRTGYGLVMRLVQALRRDVQDHVWDYALAAAMVTVALVGLITRIDVEAADAYRFRADTWWSWTLTIAICANLLGRRRWPLGSLAAGLAMTLPLELTHRRDSIAFFAILIALCTVASCLPLRLAWRGAAMVVALYATMIATHAMVLTSAPLVGTFMLAGGFVIGCFLRASRMRQQREVDAAIARRVEEVEAADLAAASERLRLAQDLHDVVAHSLSVIAVQAGIGAHLIERQPGEAAKALEAISATTRTTAVELNHLVELLRTGDASEAGPAHDLASVPELVAQIRAAGVPVSLQLTGNLTLVPNGVSLAAYRIVQEALTNVVRHAGRAEAMVSIEIERTGVRLRIDDDGRGKAGTADVGLPNREGGNGLIGMSERALMYGGEVATGPRPGGGFRVQATLPFIGEVVAGSLAESVEESPGLDSRFGSDFGLDFDRNTSPVGHSTLESRMHTWGLRDVPRWLSDVALATVMIALVILDGMDTDPVNISPHYTPTRGWVWLLRIGCCLPLATRRRFPTLSLAASWILGLALTFGDYKVGVIVFVLWIGLYSVAGYGTTTRFIGSIFGCWIGVSMVVLSKPPDLTYAGALWLAIIFLGAAVAGYAVRQDRDRRTTHLAHQEKAIDAQSQHALLAIATERLRIADELNLIITRSIQTISEEANEASALVDTDPASATRALQSISTVSRDALNDLRRLLKHIRNASEPVLYEPVLAGALTGADATADRRVVSEVTR